MHPGRWAPCRLIGGDEMAFAVADQIGAAHALQCLAQQWLVRRIMIAKESLVQAARTVAFRYDHPLGIP